MKTKKLFYVLSFSLIASPAVLFAEPGPISLVNVVAEYQSEQPATVTAQVNNTSVQFATTVRVRAQAAPVADTKSFTTVTAMQDAQAYLKTTYCVASAIQAADITVSNERASSATQLHPASVTGVTAAATFTGPRGRTRQTQISVTCP